MPHADPKVRKAYLQNYYRRNSKKIRARTKRWYHANLTRRKRVNKAWRERLRLDALTRYGGAICACCEEKNILFLTLDHTNNDGAQHRKTIHQVRVDIYAWLHKEKYPPLALRVLCFNCNMGRQRNGGTCPHQSTKIT